MSKNATAPETNQETLNLEAKKILEEAKLEAEKILQAAKESADSMLQEIAEMKKQAENEKTAPAPAPKKDDENEEYEEITLFKDGDKYKDDVYLCVNGERIQIKRGVPVKIKKKFIKLLNSNSSQRLAAANYMDQKSQEFLDETKRRNI